MDEDPGIGGKLGDWNGLGRVRGGGGVSMRVGREVVNDLMGMESLEEEAKTDRVRNDMADEGSKVDR